MTRERLPDRRPSVTMELVHDWRTYSVTMGFDINRNRIGEVFTHGAKVGSMMDAIWTMRVLHSPCCFSMALSRQLSQAAWAGSEMARPQHRSSAPSPTSSQGRHSNEVGTKRVRGRKDFA